MASLTEAEEEKKEEQIFNTTDISKFLNINDKLYELSFQIDDPVIRNIIMNDLFMVVLTGAQSSGKSSTFRRITGISLPEDSTVCTKIATLTQMRRSDDTLYKVSLKCNKENKKKEKIINSKGDIQQLVKEYQDSLLTSDKRFIDDHYIEVLIQGPTELNISLVDLPGFHNKDEDDSKIVNDLVKRYMKMDSTMVIHVCKGDQDYDTLLGNDFMRHQQNDIPRITVLTHCDTNTTKEERLQTTYDDAIKANSSDVIAIDGRQNSNDEILNKWNCIDGLKIGADSLKNVLQDKINELLPERVTNQYQKLKEHLVTKKDELAKYQTIVPVQVALDYNNAITKLCIKNELQIDTTFRKLEQSMCSEIRSIPLTNIGIRKSNTVRIFDEFEFEDLEIGDIVNFKKKKEDNKVSRGVLKKWVNKETEHLNKFQQINNVWAIIEYDTSDDEETKETQVHKSGLYTPNDISTNIISEIQELNEERGYIESSHTAAHSIVFKYAQNFANKYKVILEDFRDKQIKETFTLYEKIIDDANYDNEICQPLVSFMKQKLDKIRETIISNTDIIIDEIYDNNNNPKQINTANPHYLHELFKKMMEQDSSHASDDGAEYEIYNKIRAYLKVARKQVCEESVKRLRRAIPLYVSKEIEKLIETSTIELSKIVSEPHKRAKKRQNLEDHVECMEIAIKLIDDIMNDQV